MAVYQGWASLEGGWAMWPVFPRGLLVRSREEGCQHGTLCVSVLRDAARVSQPRRQWGGNRGLSRGAWGGLCRPHLQRWGDLQVCQDGRGGRCHHHLHWWEHLGMCRGGKGWFHRLGGYGGNGMSL